MVFPQEYKKYPYKVRFKTDDISAWVGIRGRSSNTIFSPSIFLLSM